MNFSFVKRHYNMVAIARMIIEKEDETPLKDSFSCLFSVV
jgi:hypothetical protein